MEEELIEVHGSDLWGASDPRNGIPMEGTGMSEDFREDACESFCRMERAISEQSAFAISHSILSGAAEEWDRLFMEADGISKWGDCRFFQ